MYKNGMSLMRPPAYKISLSVLKPLWYRSAGAATAPERVQSVVVAASLEITRHAALDPLEHARQAKRCTNVTAPVRVALKPSLLAMRR